MTAPVLGLDSPARVAHHLFMAKKKPARATARSPKAGKPPAKSATSSQAKRRRRSATTAVKKDTMLMQTDRGTQVRWGANQRRPSKV